MAWFTKSAKPPSPVQIRAAPPNSFNDFESFRLRSDAWVSLTVLNCPREPLELRGRGSEVARRHDVDDERQCGNEAADQGSGDNQTDVMCGHDDSLSLEAV
jgi:hypothetical protein